ncbi:MAG: hypothetical protein IPQ07_02590 [Myxococcales bacterium]|nr:hypothetical protein [Myxococcales bacterium]
MTLSFCCAACRLLQEPATECIDCGSILIGRLDTEQELLRWASLSITPEDGSTGGRSKRVTAIDIPSPNVAHEAVNRSGIARSIGAPLRSLVDDLPILAEQISLITRWRHSVFLRLVHAAPFLVEADPPISAASVRISGVLRLVPHVRPPHARLAGDHAWLAGLGIPPHFLEGASLEVVTIHPGDAVAASGVLEDTRVTELAIYRDGVDLQAMVGRAGSIVRLAV